MENKSKEYITISGYEFNSECFIVTDKDGKKSTTPRAVLKEKYKDVKGLDKEILFCELQKKQIELGLIDHPKVKIKKVEAVKANTIDVESVNSSSVNEAPQGE